MALLKRLSAIAGLSISLMFISASAQALLITDTNDPIDSLNDTGIKNNKTYSFTHDITDGLLESGPTFVFGTDTITAVTLTIYLADDDLHPIGETVTFEFDGTNFGTVAVPNDGSLTSTFSSGLLSTSAYASLLASVVDDGQLLLELTAVGDLFFLSSVLDVYFTRPITETSVAIPEPTSMGLFGIGIAGLGVILRRRKKKADVA